MYKRQALGATPTAMAWGELFSALQQGTVDGQENPLAIILTAKVYEVQKYKMCIRDSSSRCEHRRPEGSHPAEH